MAARLAEGPITREEVLSAVDIAQEASRVVTALAHRILDELDG